MSDITSNPWIIDAAAIITDRPVTVVRMEYQPAAAGNVIQIEDRNGRIVWKRTAGTFTEYRGVIVWNTEFTFNGFEVATITAGTLYVWVKVTGN